MILVNHNMPLTYCPICSTLTRFAYSEAKEGASIIRACSYNHALKVQGSSDNARVTEKKGTSFYGRRITSISR